MRDRSTNKWVARVLLFLGVSIAIVFAMYLHEVIGIEVRTVSALALTAGIFGLAVHETSDNWGHRRYWIALITCLIVHFALLATVRTYLPEFPLAILGAFGTLESAGIFWILLTVCDQC
jgi:hypothetical protein